MAGADIADASMASLPPRPWMTIGLLSALACAIVSGAPSPLTVTPLALRVTAMTSSPAVPLMLPSAARSERQRWPAASGDDGSG